MFISAIFTPVKKKLYDLKNKFEIVYLSCNGLDDRKNCVYICIYIGVKLISGPSLASLDVIIWAKFA